MNRYDDIIDFPHHISKKHRPMSMLNRAAQFSPFAALTGYDERIAETARRTAAREDMCEDDLAALDAAFQRLLTIQAERPLVTVTFFLPDDRKDGGAYVDYTGHFRAFDPAGKMLKFTEGTEIPAMDVCWISLHESRNQISACAAMR